ncbi:MAG: ABC transporter ATP-binding protein [Candidatus Pacebacteria bacterium]|nr:ABC transporter ATP-binding protein [Candidatus Paceibacterota bacterium]
MNILSIKNLTLEKSSKKLVDNVSLEIEAGKTYALVGPNGAGKSTLAYILMGLEGYREISGDIVFDGKSIKKLSVPQRAKLGITLAWQEPARFQGLKVEDFLSAAKGKNEESVTDALERVGLASNKYLSRAVDKNLSGGERKRIELAAIICMKPRLVILDEPDSGVDVEALKKVFTVMEYLKSIGTTVIVITHNMQVLKKADHAFLVCDGKLIDESKGEDVVEYFKNRCLTCPHKNKPTEDKIKKI